MHVKLFLFSYCSFFLLLTFASWYEMHLFKFVNQITCVFVRFKLQHVVTKTDPERLQFCLCARKMPRFWSKNEIVDFHCLLQCFLSKEIKTFGKENSFHSGKRWRPPDFHLDFLSFPLRISTSYFLQFPLLCNQRWCSQSPQSGYSHLNVQN